MTLLEIFYPIVLMVIGYLVEKAFSSEVYTWEGEGTMGEYLIDKGNIGLDYTLYPLLAASKSMTTDQFTDFLKQNYPSSIIANIQASLGSLSMLDPSQGTWNYIDPLEEVHPTNLTTISGLPLKPLTMICYNRFHIAFIGFKPEDPLGKTIQTYISIENQVLQRNYQYVYFENREALHDYVTSEGYGKSDKPTICFGIYFNKNANKDYSVSLHYFNDFITHGIEDVPNNLKEPNEEMQEQAIIEIGENKLFHPVLAIAENTTLPDASIDLITVWQAFHWFDSALFKNECKRILKKDAKLAILYNNWDRSSELIQKIDQLSKKYCPLYKWSSWWLANHESVFENFFTAYEKKIFPNDYHLSLEVFIWLNFSASYAPKQWEENYEWYRDELTSLFNKYSDWNTLIMTNNTILRIWYL